MTLQHQPWNSPFLGKLIFMLVIAVSFLITTPISVRLDRQSRSQKIGLDVLLDSASDPTKDRNNTIACFEPVAKDVLEASWMKNYVRGFECLQQGRSDAVEFYQKAQSQNLHDGPTKLPIMRIDSATADAKVILEGK